MALGLTVKVEAPRRRRRPGAVSKTVGSVAVGTAQALAMHVSRRVIARGDTVQTPPKYPGQKRGSRGLVSRRFIARRYPIQPNAEGQTVDTGVVFYPSSADFHAATRPGSYYVSGGMWEGLTIVPGRTAAAVKFRGRSIGQDPGKRGRGRKVSNALKAKTVLNAHGVNVLDLKDREYGDVRAGATDAVSMAVEAALGLKVTWDRESLSKLAREVSAGIL